MNKKELIRQLVKQTGLGQEEIRNVIESLIVTIKDGLKRKEEVNITGLGTFLLLKRKGYTGKNPKTGAKIEVPDIIFPHFKPSNYLKSKLNDIPFFETKEIS